MEFRLTIPEDLEFMKDNSESRGIQKHEPVQITYQYTLDDDGVILGVGGFRLINQHTAWCWVDLTSIGKRQAIATYRVIKEWIDIFVDEHDLKRIQAYVDPEYEAAIRTVEHLGFKKESIMEKFLGNRDAFMFVRVI
jgi:RimJ/RimL family protein N-acetyltransferase